MLYVFKVIMYGPSSYASASYYGLTMYASVSLKLQQCRSAPHGLGKTSLFIYLFFLLNMRTPLFNASNLPNCKVGLYLKAAEIFATSKPHIGWSRKNSNLMPGQQSIILTSATQLLLARAATSYTVLQQTGKELTYKSQTTQHKIQSNGTEQSKKFDSNEQRAKGLYCFQILWLLQKCKLSKHDSIFIIFFFFHFQAHICNKQLHVQQLNFINI